MERTLLLYEQNQLKAEIMNTMEVEQMAEPFIGEVRMFGFNFAPRDWAQCDGQVLPIEQHYSLYALLGTVFGGDGQTTFALPDMRGRVPLHEGIGYYRGQAGGLEAVPLATVQVPRSSRRSGVADMADVDSDSDSGRSARADSQPHTNIMPIQVVNFSIALDGIFPPRS